MIAAGGTPRLTLLMRCARSGLRLNHLLANRAASRVTTACSRRLSIGLPPAHRVARSPTRGAKSGKATDRDAVDTPQHITQGHRRIAEAVAIARTFQRGLRLRVPFFRNSETRRCVTSGAGGLRYHTNPSGLPIAGCLISMPPNLTSRPCTNACAAIAPT